MQKSSGDADIFAQLLIYMQMRMVVAFALLLMTSVLGGMCTVRIRYPGPLAAPGWHRYADLPNTSTVGLQCC